MIVGPNLTTFGAGAGAGFGAAFGFGAALAFGAALGSTTSSSESSSSEDNSSFSTFLGSAFFGLAAAFFGLAASVFFSATAFLTGFFSTAAFLATAAFFDSAAFGTAILRAAAIRGQFDANSMLEWVRKGENLRAALAFFKAVSSPTAAAALRFGGMLVLGLKSQWIVMM